MLPGRKVLPVALLVSVLAASLPAAEAARVAPAPDLPSPMLNAATVWTGQAIYLFGGKDADGLRDEILRYDLATGETTEVAKLPASSLGPAARQAAAAVWSGSKAYVIGGAVVDPSPPNAHRSIPDIVEFDPATNTATNVNFGGLDGLPYGLLGANVAWVGGKAYILGGLEMRIFAASATLDWHDEIFVFDPNADLGEDKVTLLTERLPYGLQDAAVAVHSGKVYLMGGYANATGGDAIEIKHVSSIVEFDPEDVDARVLGVNLPRRLQWASAGVLDGTIYVLGGREAREQDGEEVVTTSEAIIAWRPGSSPREHPLTLPIPRYAASTATTPSGIVLLGGRDSDPPVSHPGMASVYVFSGAKGPPTAPRDLEVAQDKRVTLAWSPPTYDGDAGLDGYRVERVAADGAVTVVARLDEDERSLVDASAPGSGEVTYRVVAFNGQGDGAPAVVKVRLGPRPPDAPAQASAYAGNGEVLLRWTPPPSDGGAEVSGYVVERRSGANDTFVDETDALEYHDTDVTNGVAYTYRVFARNVHGTGEAAGPLEARPRPVPPAVEGVATDDTGTEVVLTWTAAEAADSYEVLRGTDPVALARIATVADARFVDADVATAVSYWYAVRAVNEHGPGLPSEAVPVKRLEPPSEPFGLEALAGGDFVRLTWQPPNSTGGVAANEVLYLVERADDGETFTVVANDLASPVHRDGAVQTDTAYTYRVVALNAEKGRGPPSAPLLVRVGGDDNVAPRAALTAQPSGTSAGATVTFDASYSTDADGRVVEYRFDFGDGSGTDWGLSPTATHAYAANGTYTASALVRDDRGAESVRAALAQVVIGPRPDEQAPRPPTVGEDDGDGVPAADVPGSTTPDIPAPGWLAVVVGSGLLALALRRRTA